MGQGPVDLPDPLDKPPLDEKPTTDELLAQLAGDEIDRMLADADAAAPGAVPLEIPEPSALKNALDAQNRVESAPNPPQVSAAPAGDEVDVARQLDALFDELNASAPIGPPLKPKTISPAHPPAPVAVDPAAQETIAQAAQQANSEVEQQLDALFKELTSPQATTPKAANPAPQPAAESSPSTIDVAEQIGAAEKHVLSQPDGGEESHDQQEDRVPFLVRLLELVNAPLAFCSDSVRDAVGKIALMTLFNALLLLAYVAFFRHH
jgi:hypothetical protein